MSQSDNESRNLLHQSQESNHRLLVDDGATDLRASERGTVAAGCLLTFGSALLTCLLLFINGSLMMAILSAIAKTIPSELNRPDVMQFLLYSMPVVFTVLEWMMIDYVRTRFRAS